jgi:hypothetical protein
MRFEGRELKPYAEPVSADELREKEVYFSLQFLDEQLVVPVLEPLIFLGRNLRQGDVDRFYFQSFESFKVTSFPPDAERDTTEFQVYGPDNLSHIFDYERALDVLLICSVRRKGIDS